MAYVFSAALGYLFGCFNPAQLFATLKGHDIKREGSGNAGASNAAIVLGFGWGVIVALLDIFKSFFAMFLASRLFPQAAYAYITAGTACVIGHLYPATMRFRGGKGLASLAGMVLYYDWRLFLALAAFAVFIVVVTKYIFVVAVSVAVVFPLALGFVFHDVAAALIVAIAVPFILGKHVENMRRVARHEELRITWLWKKDAQNYKIPGSEKKK